MKKLKIYNYRMEYWQNVANGSLFSKGQNCCVPVPVANNLPRRLSDTSTINHKTIYLHLITLKAVDPICSLKM